MTRGDEIKARILEIVGSEWMGIDIVGAATLSTQRLRLPCNREGARQFAANLYELRIRGLIEARKVGVATGFNQIRRTPGVTRPF